MRRAQPVRRMQRQQSRSHAECMRAIPRRLEREDLEYIMQAAQSGSGPFAGRWIIVGDFGWCEHSKAAMRLVCDIIGQKRAVLLDVPRRRHDRLFAKLSEAYGHATVPLVIDDAGRYVGGVEELMRILQPDAHD